MLQPCTKREPGLIHRMLRPEYPGGTGSIHLSLMSWALSYYSDRTLWQEFQPMAAKLSMKAALPLAKILTTASCRSSKTGPWLLTSPRHQQPWFRPSRSDESLPSTRTYYNQQRHYQTEIIPGRHPRHRDRHLRQTSSQTSSQTGIISDRHHPRQTSSQTDVISDRHNPRQTSSQTDIISDRHHPRQTSSQTDIISDRHNPRETSSQTVSERSNLTAFLGTTHNEVHIVHISRVITAFTLESLSSLT